jgi:hypothetical protein
MSDKPNLINNGTETGFLIETTHHLSEAIRTEFELISSRISWLVTSEAFIFAAFSTLVACSSHEITTLQHTRNLLLQLLPILGLALSIVAMIALQAANKAIIKLKSKRDEMLEYYPKNIKLPLISSNDIEHCLGNIPSIVLPLLFMIIWILLYYSVFIDL